MHAPSRVLPLESIAEDGSDSELEAAEASSSSAAAAAVAAVVSSSSSSSSSLAFTRKQFKNRAKKRKPAARLAHFKRAPKPAAKSKAKAKAKAKKVRHHIDVFNQDAFNFD